jgi:hypothetical protein
LIICSGFNAPSRSYFMYKQNLYKNDIRFGVKNVDYASGHD